VARVRLPGVRFSTAIAFAAGFLLGSRSGRGPWEQTEAALNRVRSQVDQRTGAGHGDPTGDGSWDAAGRLTTS
jgi:hypothetical protein